MFEDDLPDVHIYGEVHSLDGSGINNDLEIVATAFNEDGKVIPTESTYIEQDEFFTLHPLNLSISDIISKPVKIRIYPKLM